MDLASLTPLGGGWSGETFLGEVAGERVVVRLYAGRGAQRGPAAPEVDAAVLTLVRGLLPVPEVLEVRCADAEAGTPGLLVTSYVEGVRGDEVLAGLLAAGDEAAVRKLGRAVGDVAAALAAMPVLRAGAFVDAELRLGALPGPETLAEWVAEHVSRWPAWTHDGRAGLLVVADEADALLDTVTRRSVVHGDLNPKNLLVDPGSLAVVAVLDWEFVHAGHPATDLGNLVRFDRSPAWVDGVVGAWTSRHRLPGGVTEALALARAADLWALVDLADRRGDNPVADRAAAQLEAIATTRDLHAVAG